MLAGPRDAHVEEPALLFQLARLGQRTEVGEDPLLEPHHEDGRVLQALGGVQCHQRDAGTVAVDLVGVGHEGHRLEEAEHVVEVGGLAGQLGQVLDPAVGLDGCARPPARPGSPCARPPAARSRPDSPSAPAGAARPASSRSCSAPFRALPDRPASAARSMASLKETCSTWAQAARRATEVSPMPRLGTLTMRRADTSSSGLASTRTKARMSLISLRS